MLTLYDDKTIGNKEYIKDIEASFAFYKDAIVKLPQLAEICSKIDNISYIKGAYIETPFGATSIDDLSTGCKALLLAILLSTEDIIVSFVESGENVLSFALRKGYKINIYCLSTLQIVYKGCHQMLVLIEDSNSGFTFYKWFLCLFLSRFSF